jgi:tetratricopeptide (TPR) repeat protein
LSGAACTGCYVGSITITSAPSTGGKNLKNVLLLLMIEYSILPINMARRKANKKQTGDRSFKLHQELEVKNGRSSSPFAESSPRKKPLYVCAQLLLLLLVFLVYLHALSSDFVSYDDQVYVTGNYHVQHGLTWDNVKWAFCTSTAANWHPVTWLSHMLDCELFGLKAWGHHLTNLLLHTANTFLVFLVLRRMTGAFWRSWFVAGLFGLHPMHVESVAWVAERKDVLSTLFWLLTLWAYARYAQKRPRVESRGSGADITVQALDSRLSTLDYFLALLLFACGLMSKPMVVTLPFVLLLLDYWPLNRFGNNRVWPLVMEKLPFFLLAAASSVVTFVVQRTIGAVATTTTLPMGARLENALVSYAGYLGKLLFPTNLAVIYPYSYPLQWPLGNLILAGVLLLGISIFVITMRRRQPWLLVGWLWFAGTLVPVIGLVQVGFQAMADRYSYVPSIGLFILLNWGAWGLTKGWRYQAIVLSGAATVSIVLCAGLAWQQVGYWKNSRTLFQHTIDVTENNFIAYSNLGGYEFDQGHYDEAIDLCREAIKLMPSYQPAYALFGAALCKSGRLEEGIPELQLALKMDPNSPQTHSDLADALVKKGETGDAINEYKETIRLNPEFLDAYNRLGILLENSGRLGEAIQQFEEVIRIDPAYVGAYNNLGLALESQGRLDEAFGKYQEAVRLDPSDAKGHFCLGMALKKKGRLDESIGQLEEGLKLEPDSPQGHDELGVMLGQKGRWDEAITQFQEAIRLKPDYDEAKHNLSSALKKKATSAKP